MKNTEIKKFLQLYSRIRQNVLNCKSRCMCKDCDETAINSHLLQKNGILSRIFESGHVYEPRQNDLLNDSFGLSPFGFKKVGINKALSISLFCNKHDTTIFKEIETKDADLTSYRSHLLLTYRTTCAEKRRKEREIEICKRVLNSNILRSQYGSRLQFMKDLQDGFTYGNLDLEKYKNKLEAEIENPSEAFVFYDRNFPISGIYASSTFSLTDDSSLVDLDSPLGLFILHIIPEKNGSKIILGYEKKYVKSWQKNYIERIINVDDNTIEEYLTSLFIRVNGWGISPNVFNQLSKDKIDYFFKLFEEDIFNIISEDYTFNLFDGALLRANNN